LHWHRPLCTTYVAMQTRRPMQYQMAQVGTGPSLQLQAPARFWVRTDPRQSQLQVELQQGQALQPETVTRSFGLVTRPQDDRMSQQLQEQMRAHLWAQVQVGVPMTGWQPQAVEGLLTNVNNLAYGTPTTLTHHASYQGLPTRPVEAAAASPATVSTARLAGNDSCATLPPKAEKVELSAGCTVYIDTSRFKIVSPLGVGSYGMVWSASSDDGQEVAVKEILCRSQAELNNAHFEGGLLDRLGTMKLGGRNSGDSLRMPALVVQETEYVESLQSWRVRLAMSRIPGTPLMILLEQKRMERGMHEKMRDKPESVQPSIFSSGVLRPLADACRLTRALVVQLFPTLESISLVYYHRDINPRNILVDGVDGSTVSYGLVDFGMAVDALKWRDDSAVGTWQTLEVGGDCRYWPVSAWVMFLHGPQEVQPGGPWRLEYQTQLDIHALGITALQVLIDLSPVLPQADDASDGCLREIAENASDEGEMALLMAKMRLLQDAWTKYWEDSTDFWNCLIECFTTGGDWNALKIACVNHGVQDIVTKDLKALRTALSDAADAASACNSSTLLASGEAQMDVTMQDLQGVLRAMYLMISTGESDQFPTWDIVRDLMGLPPEVEIPETNIPISMPGPRAASMTPRRPSSFEIGSARKGSKEIGGVGSPLVMENGNLIRPNTRHSAPYGGSSVVPALLSVTPRRGSSVVVEPASMDSVVVRSARDAGKRAGAAPPSSWKGPPNQTVAGGVSVGVNGPVGTRVITREASAAGNLKAPPMSPMLVRRGVSAQSAEYGEPPSRMVSAAVTPTCVRVHPSASMRQPSQGPGASALVIPPASVREPSTGRRSTTNLVGAHTPLPPSQYANPPQSPVMRHRTVGSSVAEEAPVMRSPSVVRGPAMSDINISVTQRMRGSSVIVEAAPRTGLPPSGIRTTGSSVVVEGSTRGASVMVEASQPTPVSGRGRPFDARVADSAGRPARNSGSSLVMPNMYAGSSDVSVAGSAQMALESEAAKVTGYVLSASPAGSVPNHAMGVMRTPVVCSRNGMSIAATPHMASAAYRRPSPATHGTGTNHASLVVPIPPPRGLPTVNLQPGQMPLKMQL